MHPNDGGKLNGLKDLLFCRSRLESILYVTAHAWAIKMGRRRIYCDED